MPLPSLLFAYFGPETIMPMTSVVATVFGVTLMFGRNTFRFAWRMVSGLVSRPAPVSPLRMKPHFLGRAGNAVQTAQQADETAGRAFAQGVE